MEMIRNIRLEECQGVMNLQFNADFPTGAVRRKSCFSMGCGVLMLRGRQH
jgi:hypothetical protein